MLIEGSFTIYFDDPFWVGLWERRYNGKYEVARYVFGSEPTNAELRDFLVFHYDRLCFSVCECEYKNSSDVKYNFKRNQKKAKSDYKSDTKSKSAEIFSIQQALYLENKRHTNSQKNKENKDSLFSLRKIKKKKKKRGH